MVAVAPVFCRCENGDKILIEIRVSTNSPKESVEVFGGGLKVRVKSKPIEGRANAEVIELVAAHYGVSRNSVKITRGESSSKKVLEVSR